MASEQQIVFGDFRLDLVNECLWRNKQSIPLPPKEFALLLYLTRNPGRLITKDELIEAVWPETTVTDGVLKVSIRKIRSKLEDDTKSPQFIETAHRRGYRFIGQIGARESKTDPVPTRPPAPPSRPLPSLTHPRPGTGALSFAGAGVSPSRLSGAYRLSTLLPAAGIVGRDAALAELQQWLERALGGTRTVVFVTGEAGIGKTTVVEAFLQMVRRDSQIWVGHGQCLEQYGAGEAYLPILEAISRLCQEPGRKSLIDLLRRRAPTWLQQMPWLIADEERENVERDVIGATGERMMREMAEALETLANDAPVVLVLEDLHWSDYSTLDLVSYLARRRNPARLLILATYRPVEVALSEHPLKGVKRELQTHRQCEELPLEYLSQDAVAAYLHTRFAPHEFPQEFTELLHQRTEGNPFFLVNAVEYLESEKLVAQVDGHWRVMVALAELEVGVPENIRQMIERQIERLDRDQQRLLEVAAVAGVEFAAAAVAFGLEKDLAMIEEQCEELDRRHQFLRASGVSTWPNGVVTARYGFNHALYQEVIYERIAAGRRARLHQIIGERGEQVYGENAWEVAAELAMHFEQGRDYRRAVTYLRRAAQNHFLRYANREALNYLNRALTLLDSLPEAERTEARLAMLEEAGFARLAMGDMAGAAADFEALAEYARLQSRLDDEIHALDHLATALSWVDRDRCLAAADRFLTLSNDVSDDLLRAHLRGCWSYWQVLFKGWKNEHDEALGAAVTAARDAGNQAVLSLHLARYCFFRCLCTEYDIGCAMGEDSARFALEASDAHSYLLAQYFRVWGLLHSGRWGEVLGVIGEGGAGWEMAARNDHRRWSVLLRVELAWLNIQAFDFEAARRICEEAFAPAQALQHAYTESLNLILLGQAHVGLGNLKDAALCFDMVKKRLDREPILMDWILRMPLHHGLSRYWLAYGNYEEARREAERLCELADQPGERTYLAMGLATIAEIALIRDDRSLAQDVIDRAIEVISRGRVRLAEWRVHQIAARIFETSGQFDEATRHGDRSVAILTELAQSLPENTKLRESVLKELPSRRYSI